ncbi:SDR family oxidoreductase [Streptomyces sp. NPDC054863]
MPRTGRKPIHSARSPRPASSGSAASTPPYPPCSSRSSLGAALDIGPRIRVNAVAPGPVQTGWMSDELIAQVVPDIPMARVGTPADIADACVFLAPAQARQNPLPAVEPHESIRVQRSVSLSFALRHANGRMRAVPMSTV